MTYPVPIHIVDQNSITYSDEEMLLALQEHKPRSKLKPGDLAVLMEPTSFLQMKFDVVPRFWQIRFVISAWTHELYRLVHSHYNIGGIDHAVSLLEEQNFTTKDYQKPVIYAHGFPHGLYPDTATWFPEWLFRKVPFNDPNQEWKLILDEAKAPFIGYDETGLMVPYTLDLAPDEYSSGENLGRPFSFEDATTHTLALLGGEEALFRPVNLEELKNPRILDPRHDLFK